MNRRSAARPRRGGPDRALMGWMWRRVGLGIPGLLVTCAVMIMLLIPARAGAVQLPVAVISVSLSGLFVAQIFAGKQQTASFLLARPVNRRHVYNVSLLAYLLMPWLMLAVLPAGLFALLPSLLHVHPYSCPPAIVDLELVVWTLVFYLISVCISITFAGTAKTARTPLPGWLTLVLVSVGSIWAWIIGWAALLAFHWRTWPSPPPAAYPALTAFGLILAAMSYQAGWRLFRKLDL